LQVGGKLKFNNNKRLGYRWGTPRQWQITLKVASMKYLQLHNIKCTVLWYSPMKNTMILKHELRGHSRSSNVVPFD